MSTESEEHNNTHRHTTIESFFTNGPLKVTHLKQEFPFQNNQIIQNTTNSDARVNNENVNNQKKISSLPCTYNLTHIDQNSYPKHSVKEHTPAYKRYIGLVKNNDTSEIVKKEIFLKYTGILDANELVSNKYGDVQNDEENHPTQSQKKNDKTQCTHNTAYVDSLACHLTSKLTENNVCPHFPIVYGIYNGIADKHYVEFTEEYYDHRHNAHFMKGVEEEKWKMIPHVSDSDSENDFFDDENDDDENDDDENDDDENDDDENDDNENENDDNDDNDDNENENDDNDIEKLLLKLQQKHGETDVQALMEKLLLDDDKEGDSEDNCEENVKNEERQTTCSTVPVMNPVKQRESLDKIYSSSELDTNCCTGVDIDENGTVNNAYANDTDSDVDSHNSIFSNDSNNPILDVSELTELSINDIDVFDVSGVSQPNTENMVDTGVSNDNTIYSPKDTNVSPQCELHSTSSAVNLLENTDFVDTLQVHEEHLKLRNGCDFMDFQSRYLQMSNVPVQIVAMEAYELMFETVFKEDFVELEHYKTLFTREVYLGQDHRSINARFCAFKWLFMTKQHLFEKKWTALLCQVCMALVAIQYRYDMVHNDMHGQNIMLEKTDKLFLNYKVGNSFYKIPTYGYIVKLIDMGRTTYQLQDTLYMGDVFRNRGEAGEQYSYIHQYKDAATDPEKRKHMLLPNPCFDLTRLACSLLDEFYGGGVYYENENKSDERSFTCASNGSQLYSAYENEMFRPPTTSTMFNMLCEWITDAEKEPVNRYENFDLYKQIARRMRRSLPVHQLTRPHFNVYRCEEADDTHYYNLTEVCEFNVGVDHRLDRPIYDSDVECGQMRNEECTTSESHDESETSEEDEENSCASDNELDCALEKIVQQLKIDTPHTK